MRTRRTRTLSFALVAGLLLAVPASVAASEGRPHYIRPGAPGEPSVRIDPNTIAVPLPSQLTHHEAHFLTHMTPHHGQALYMGDLAATRAQDVRIQNLAMQIAATQDAEIEQMASLLRRYGHPVPDPMDWEGHEGMPGMLSTEQLEQLASASGRDFDLLFLEFMIFHHFGAMTMAQDLEEMTNRVLHPDVSDIVWHVLDTQWTEIKYMQVLQRELGG